MDEILLGMPKAEMHLHFEGAVRWSTIRELHPDGAGLPATAPWLGLRTLSEAVVWKAIVRGCERAMTQYPIDVRPILGLARHHAPAKALATLDAVADCALAPGWLAGIDLRGDERLGTATAFVEVFRRAAALGLKLRAHAGEMCGAASVREAISACGVRQVSHGVRAIEDPALVRELVRQDVVLHVCPTSNVVLGYTESYGTHALRGLLDAGARCTVDSDDPLLFGTDIQNEYRVLVREMGFTPAEVGELAKNAFHASLLDGARVDAFCREIERAGGDRS